MCATCRARLQEGDNLTALLVWIDKEPLQGSVLFVARPRALIWERSICLESPYKHPCCGGAVPARAAASCPQQQQRVQSGLCLVRARRCDVSLAVAARLGVTCVCGLQVLDALAIVVLCPGAVFALAAGAMFSLAQGTALVWLGTSLGQTLAFIIGRCVSTRAPLFTPKTVMSGECLHSVLLCFSLQKDYRTLMTVLI